MPPYIIIFQIPVREEVKVGDIRLILMVEPTLTTERLMWI